MLTLLQRRSNGTTVLSTRQESKPTSPAAPAHPVVNSNPTPPAVNQVPPNNIPTDSSRKATPAAGVTNSPPPVAITPPQPAAITPPQPSAITNVHSSSVPPVAAPSASAPPRTTTLASPPPLKTNSAQLSPNGYPNGLASTRSALLSNTSDTHSGGIASSEHHTSTGVMVAIGLSGIAITLMFLILIRFFVRCLRKKTSNHQSAEANLIVIPSTAFLDHPKNQGMGGVGASPSAMVTRSASTSSVRSNMSFKKPQDQSLITYMNQSHYDVNSYSNHGAVFHEQPAMEFLHPMGTPYTQPKAWDGSRPSLANDRPHY